jgi:glycyl-tRNA synthetase
MEKIVSLCKRRGFIFQSSEIYGGLNGFWDYGPLGAELKRNIKESWWRSMTHSRDDVVGLDASIIMHPKIWEASGHTSTFSDLMVDCLLTKKRFRADQVEPQSGTAYSYTGANDRSKFISLLNQYPQESQKAVEAKIREAAERIQRSISKALLADGVGGDLAVKTCTQEFAQFQSEFQLGGCPSFEQLHEAFTEFKWSKDAYSVLIATGKHAEYARKVARQFYQQRGIENPELQGERSEEVKDSRRYNPENGSLLTEPRPFNLMLKTYVGPVESPDNLSYLRPETAQAIFVQFKNTLDVSRQKVPFGVCQIGKAFRNEINPRNFTFRSREFEQMELEFFIRPDEVVQKMAGSVAKLSDSQPSPLTPQPNWGWELWHKYWVEQRVRWYESIGLGRDTLVEYWQKKEELAHYARATVDILYKFPFGTQELEGIAARGNFDLTQHQKFSGKSMEYFDDEAKAKYVPHVIEPSAGVDRLALALICNAYCEDQAPDEKGKMESRVVMKFHPRIAPIKVAVFPLLKNKPELVKKAKEVRELLRPHMSVFYDEAGAIGRRYRRQDEAGTPFGLTVDFDTLGEKGPELQDTVTLRDRDSMKQERIKIGDLVSILLEKIR